MDSGSSVRGYRVRVFALGIVGLCLMTAFALAVRARLRAEWEEAREAEWLRRLAALRGILIRLYDEEVPPLVRALPGRGMADRRFWEHADRALDDDLLRLLGAAGLEAVDAGGRVLFRAGAPGTGRVAPDGPGALAASAPLGGLAAAALLVPGEGAPAEQTAVVHVWFHGRAGESDRLGRFFLLGSVFLGTTLYLLFAVWALLNRRQEAQLRKEREQRTRLAAMAEMAGGIAHEVRNPMNAIGLSVQYLERTAARGPAPQDPAGFARIHHELDRIRRVVDHFVAFARLGEVHPERVDLGELLSRIAARRMEAPGPPRLEATLSLPPGMNVLADPEKLREALEALFQVFLYRAGEASAARVGIAAKIQRREVAVEFLDEVPLDDEELKRWVDAGARNLGRSGEFSLIMARACAESHGGRIEVRRGRTGGLSATLVFARA